MDVGTNGERIVIENSTCTFLRLFSEKSDNALIGSSYARIQKPFGSQDADISSKEKRMGERLCH